MELGRSDRRVGELVQLVGKPQNLVSYHLAELRQAGIVRARRSSADGRDVYYSADLFRCRDLLGEAGRSLHPGLSLASTQPAGAAPRRARPRAAVPLHRQQRALPDRRSRHGAPIGWRRRGTQRGESSQAAASERGARHGGARHRHLQSPYEVAHPLHPQPLRSGHHALRQGARGLPGVPGGADRRALEHRRSRRRRRQRQATYPAFEHVADEIEGRVALLLADLTSRPLERTHHG